MPGQRYNFRMLRGPWKGRRARIRGTGAIAGHWLVDIEGIQLKEGGIPSVPWQWLQEIKQPTTATQRKKPPRK